MIVRTSVFAFLIASMALLATANAPAWAGDSSSSSSTGKSGSQQGSARKGKEMAPEFGPSVVFDRGDAPIQLADLRGKTVVIMFFQSWCPICNGWSPDLIGQMQSAFGGDATVALVAIKVDGGTPGEAKGYLREHKADLSKWIVASDNGGLYYQRVSGTDRLWGYALVDGEGRLVERGHAGSFWPQPSGAKKFVLADPDLKHKAPHGADPLPVDESTPAGLRPAALAANSGHWALALRALKSWDHGKTKDAAEAMRAALLDAVGKQVEKAAADLKSDDPQTRFEAFRTLSACSQLAEPSVAQPAKAALGELKTDKSLAKELADEQRAQSTYWALLARSQRLDLHQRQAQLPGALQQFATTFDGTAYAQRARDEAHTIELGQLTAAQ